MLPAKLILNWLVPVQYTRWLDIYGCDPFSVTPINCWIGGCSLTTFHSVRKKMSAHDPPSPRSTRSASPISVSSESESEESVVHLSSIKTLAEFYRTLVLNAAAPEKVRHKPDPTLLDRISLLCVGGDFHESNFICLDFD